MAIELHYADVGADHRLHVAVVPGRVSVQELAWVAGPLSPADETVALAAHSPGIIWRAVQEALHDRGWAVLGSGFH